jgi:pyrimidine-nucleoside phosphorylase
MVAIGHHAGRNTIALITNMDRPLGKSIGNSLEVIEAIETLRNNGPADFTELCIELAANMLLLAEKGTLEECRAMAQQTLLDGSALQKFREMCAAQGGNPAVCDDYSLFPQASIRRELYASESGFIASMATQSCGTAAMLLGAGRATKEDSIDHSAGILLHVKPGDSVEKGQLLAELFTNDENSLTAAEKLLRESIRFSAEQPQIQPLIYERVEFE